MRKHGLERLFAVSRLRHHRNVALNIEQRGQGAKHHSLVFGQHYADTPTSFDSLSRALFLGIQLWTPSLFDTVSFNGSVMVSVVPASVLRSSVPPSISTRSRMPRRPLPSPLELPRPSSWISRRQVPFCCSRRMRHDRACA